MNSTLLEHASDDSDLRILLIEDEPDIYEPIEGVLKECGHRVAVAADGGRAMGFLDREAFDLVISDVRLPTVDGLTIFKRIQKDFPNTSVILMSAYGSISEAVAALRDNAFHYLPKPFDLDELVSTVRQVAQQHRLSTSLNEPEALEPFETALVGQSPGMVALRKLLAAMAHSDAPVLIHGESGTGKELVARAIHEQGPHASGPLVAINCAAFPETLIEAELFGHERGAFTGATRTRQGRFEAADGGTLFLDEVTEMPPSAQAKLLRVLQEGTFQPLGSNRTVTSNVRILSATNAEPKRKITEGTFREDLYYRLKVLEVRLPPLRERRGDLPILIAHFLRKYGGDPSTLPNLSARAWAALGQYCFPGNVRELEHAVRHGLVLSNGADIDLEHLPEEIRGRVFGAVVEKVDVRALSEAVGDFEREYLLRVLERVQWNRSEAAKLLGISRKNLWEKVKRHRLEL